MKPTAENPRKSLLSTPLTASLKGIRRGIERESLRVRSDAQLAQTDHPISLGSALTHKFITTDYAEAMLEFITPVSSNAESAYNILADIHSHAYHRVGDELLWPLSMPCRIPSEDQIRLARYGRSNLGQYKSIYRQGLRNRYGSLMQVISGVHYNFSMPDDFWPLWRDIKGSQKPLKDFISESYMGLVRNFFRYGWLLTYLFGASPAADLSFLEGGSSTLPLERLGRHTVFLPGATSLRMSSLGYKSKAQDMLSICYNSLDEFVRDLRLATTHANVTYAKIGLKCRGNYQQLNMNTLQNEGELYAPIRPKCVLRAGETLSDGLERKGIDYVEIRSLDIDPYAEAGISLKQIYFLDVFLTYCLLKDSPSVSQQQQDVMMQNFAKVAGYGRTSTLQLLKDGFPISMKSWAEEVFADMSDIASALDSAYCSELFRQALANQQVKLNDQELTPSAMLLNDMKCHSLDMTELAMKLARKNRRALLARNPMLVSDDDFAKEAEASLARQRAIEAADTLNFDEFLQRQSRPCAPVLSPRNCTNRFCRLPTPLEPCVGH